MENEALFSFDSRLRAPKNDRRNSSPVAFAVWAAIALIVLAIVSVAFGVAPAIDPPIFPRPLIVFVMPTQVRGPLSRSQSRENIESSISERRVKVLDSLAHDIDHVGLDLFSLPIATYTRSCFLTARLAARRMVVKRSGVIMIVTSVSSRTGIPLTGGIGPAMASDAASAMTGTVVNLSMGSLDD